MAEVLTFTDAEGVGDIHIIKEKIVAYRKDKSRPGTRIIYTECSAAFLVKESMEEIYNAINGNVTNEPTNDFA